MARPKGRGAPWSPSCASTSHGVILTIEPGEGLTIPDPRFPYSAMGPTPAYGSGVSMYCIRAAPECFSNPGPDPGRGARGFGNGAHGGRRRGGSAQDGGRGGQGGNRPGVDGRRRPEHRPGDHRDSGLGGQDGRGRGYRGSECRDGPGWPGGLSAGRIPTRDGGASSHAFALMRRCRFSSAGGTPAPLELLLQERQVDLRGR